VAYVQTQFDKFDENIRLGRFEENAALREKRDIIRDRLDERLPGVFEEAGEECPPYYYRNQGSYEIGTGVVPTDGDFDIDQGLYFEVSTNDYPDPVVLKERVCSALEGHTDDVCIRRSCVTVFYHNDGERIYHVDIAVYSDGQSNGDGKSRIAKGKANSGIEYRIWEVSDPQALTDAIDARFLGTNDRAQFRRTVRYLKRWKDINFIVEGNAAPIGIGLTGAVYYHLRPTYKDVFSGKADDLLALKDLVQTLLGEFREVWDTTENKSVRRLVVNLPVEPWNDLFSKMTNKQMEEFEAQLKSLASTLESAYEEVDPVVACQILQTAFGEDFPVPPPEETAKRHSPAIVSSSSSA
jgi:hypothetical protein